MSVKKRILTYLLILNTVCNLNNIGGNTDARYFISISNKCSNVD